MFRLRTSDGAEFLFGAEDSQNLDEWVKKIAFHAALAPSQQLLSYDAYLVSGDVPSRFVYIFVLLVSLSIHLSIRLPSLELDLERETPQTVAGLIAVLTS